MRVDLGQWQFFGDSDFDENQMKLSSFSAGLHITDRFQQQLNNRYDEKHSLTHVRFPIYCLTHTKIWLFGYVASIAKRYVPVFFTLHLQSHNFLLLRSNIMAEKAEKRGPAIKIVGGTYLKKHVLKAWIDLTQGNGSGYTEGGNVYVCIRCIEGGAKSGGRKIKAFYTWVKEENVEVLDSDFEPESLVEAIVDEQPELVAALKKVLTKFYTCGVREDEDVKDTGDLCTALMQEIVKKKQREESKYHVKFKASNKRQMD